jgi:arylsulfatase A
MKRRKFIKTASQAGVSLAAFQACGKTEPPTQSGKHPNFVLFFIDDMGYGDISPFGSTENTTPHLARMAREGVIFRDFYVSSTACTPSRSSLMTGCYAQRVGMDGRVNYPSEDRGLNPDEITIADLLKTQGYATGCFGKWHLGDQPEFLPTKQGFDEYAGIPYSNDMWPHHPGVVKTMGGHVPPLPFIKGDRPVAHIPDGKNQALVCDAVTDAAVDFIKRHRDEPFFAYIPHSAVHNPVFVEKYKAERADDNVFRAQVDEVDVSVGRVLDTLEELGLSENTLVFFTSDNGGASKSSMGPLRGGKGGPAYEGHNRVPTITWWPGRIPAGVESREIGASIDILPTFAHLAGVEPPKDRIIDGHNITDVLLAKPGAKSPNTALYYGTKDEPGGVRQGQWKLVKVKKKHELYNLDDDIGEQNDLAQQHPEKLAELKALLSAHAQDLKDNARPAAFVNNPKPLLENTDNLPTLAEYMGRTGIDTLPLSNLK